MEARPELARCAVDCKHCGIRFLTHPRNADREDLRCPFGCREHHRRELGKERSRRHYQKAEAKTKKAFRNAQRSFPADFDDANFSADGNLSPSDNASPGVDPSGDVDDRSFPGVVSAELPAAKPCLTDSHREATNIENPEEALLNLEISLGGVVLDGASVVNSPTLPYVRMAVGLIVGKSISKEELFAGLLKIVSQRSIDQQRTTRYVSRFPDQHPP